MNRGPSNSNPHSKQNISKNLFWILALILYVVFIAIESIRPLFFLFLFWIILTTILCFRLDFSIYLIFLSLFFPIPISIKGIILQSTDFLIGYTFVLVVIKYLIDSDFKLPKPPYAVFISLFLLSAILSVFNAKDKFGSLSDIIQMIEIYVIAGILFKKFINDRITRSLIKLLLFMILIQVFWILPSLLSGERFGGIFGGIFYYISVFACIISYHLMIYQKGKLQIFYGFIFAIITFELLATGTRGGWISVIVGIFCANLLISKRLLRKTIVILLIIVTFIATFGTSLVSERLKSIADPTYFSNVSRFYLILSAANAFLEHPIIGIGIKNLHRQIPDYLPSFTRELPQNRINTIVQEIKNDAGAHNMYFEVLAEMGILGIICLFFLMKHSIHDAAANFKISVSNYQKMKNSSIFSCLISFYTVALFFPGIHVRVDSTLFLIILLSLIEYEKGENKQNISILNDINGK